MRDKCVKGMPKPSKRTREEFGISNFRRKVVFKQKKEGKSNCED
jgi:hypothetical protein